eukprot:gene14554-17010_t
MDGVRGPGDRAISKADDSCGGGEHVWFDSAAMNDTIFGLATAAGRSAVAVVRVSGPASHEVLGSLTKR